MRNIIVTGGNRGLGAGLVRYFLSQGDHVCATVRSQESFEELKEMSVSWLSDGGSLSVYFWNAETPWNVSGPFLKEIESCDILINNAGWGVEIEQVVPEGQKDHVVFSTSTDDMMKAFLVNCEAPRVLMSLVVPFMIKRGYGRVVNLASARASMENRVGDTNTPGYRLSKAALIAMTKEAAHEFQEKNVKFNALCPGWCKTRMGGESAPDEVEDGVRRIVSLCGSSASDPHGQFFVDGVSVGTV